MKLPRKLDLWLARRTPNLYVVLWAWGLVRNEPPPGWKPGQKP